ncbi:hypothetical protein B9Z55_009774 [Caenorhabditis nigoni]|uniref:SWIM-type domain-containing protein n=1 Tax=Caenorhabditis nigoni TaxID=1611254 RepID=A0A2G5UTI0_9PELO|nr:hypothetical protein B9Z55_009774 [Caenorhabditis nigoni]
MGIISLLFRVIFENLGNFGPFWTSVGQRQPTAQLEFFFFNFENVWFSEAEEVDLAHLLKFKNERSLLIKIPSRICEKNPVDNFVWSKTKKNQDGTVAFRHQPRYMKIELFGTSVQSLKCTDLNDIFVHKQVFEYLDYTYSIYFTSSSGEIHICDAPIRKRLDKLEKEHIKTSILPMRSITHALKVANSSGIRVTRKQMANMARGVENVVYAKTGPRSKTSMVMVRELALAYPDTLWFQHDNNNLLTDITFVQVFEENCKIFLHSCPTQDQWNDWQIKVDSIKNGSDDFRKSEIKRILGQNPTGVIFPSRLNVDVTFNLGDVYVTAILGETKTFKTMASKKPRVLPLAYMLHATKSAHNHEKFATILKETFDKLQIPSEPRKIPCFILDGEVALENYPTILDTAAVRCDVHLLSLLRYEYAGKRAVEVAKPYLFGKMVNGKWKTGLLGVFDELTFQRRLKCFESRIDPKIVDWIEKNKAMLLESASAISKLRAGHLLQFSTNNANENFNAIIKTTVSKRFPVPELIRRLNSVFQEKHRECFLSALDGSEYVYFTLDLDGLSVDDRINAYSTAGLSSPCTLALNPPLRLAERFDLQKLYKEESHCANIQFQYELDDTYHLLDTTRNGRDKFIHVAHKNHNVECWNCGSTLPDFLCCHVIFVLCRLTQYEIDSYWSYQQQKTTRKQINAFPARSGSKISDRIGSKNSAQNHVRKIAEISSITVDTAPSPSSPTSSLRSVSPPPNGSFSASTPSAMCSTPLSSSDVSSSTSYRRKSDRSRKPIRKYTPSKRNDDSTSSGDSTVF